MTTKNTLNSFILDMVYHYHNLNNHQFYLNLVTIVDYPISLASAVLIQIVVDELTYLLVHEDIGEIKITIFEDDSLLNAFIESANKQNRQEDFIKYIIQFLDENKFKLSLTKE